MSEATRQALAAAASTVAGITCTPYFRQTTKPGNAMVRRDRTTYPNAFGGVVRWQIVVMLPQSQEAAEKFMDEKLPTLVAALSPEMRVEESTPQQLALDSGSVSIALITGAREE